MKVNKKVKEVSRHDKRMNILLLSDIEVEYIYYITYGINKFIKIILFGTVRINWIIKS